MLYPIVPAVIPESEAMLRETASRLSFSREIHVDIVDGRFVEKVSWPIDPVGEPVGVKTQLDAFTLEVDLMVCDPLSYAAEWIIAGADMLVFHIETISVKEFALFADNTDVSVGISKHGDRAIDDLMPYLEFADYAQLMGIREIGAQGLPFYDRVLEEIEELRRECPNLMLSVDGSINRTTIKNVQAAGADRFIVGSAITKQPQPEQAWKDLSALINA